MYESRRSVSYSHAERRIASPNQTGTCLFSFLSHIAESACVCVLVFARVRLLVSFVLHSSSPSYTQCRPPYLSSSLFFFSSHLPFHTFFFSSFFFACFFSLRLLELIYSLLEVLRDFCDCGHLATRILLFSPCVMQALYWKSNVLGKHRNSTE